MKTGQSKLIKSGQTSPLLALWDSYKDTIGEKVIEAARQAGRL